MRIFFAYPYALDRDRNYRDRLLPLFEKAGIDLTFADDHLSNKHVLEKIRDLLEDSDLVLFDLTDANPNVTLELGIAIAANLPYIVAIRQDALSKLNSDIHGWDQLRYADEGQLARILIDRVQKGRVPARSVDPKSLTVERFEPLGFGLPLLRQGGDHANIGIAIRPLLRTPIRLQDLLADQYKANRRFGEIITSIANQEQAKSYWNGGFTPRAREDYLELTATSEEGLRLYVDGSFAYYRSLPSREPVSLKPATLEELCRMSLLVAQATYLDYNVAVERVAFLATLQPTRLFLIDKSRPDFVPSGYRGEALDEGTPEELHIPKEPAVVTLSAETDGIRSCSREVERIFKTYSQRGA